MRQNSFSLAGLFVGERLWDKTSVAVYLCVCIMYMYMYMVYGMYVIVCIHALCGGAGGVICNAV